MSEPKITKLRSKPVDGGIVHTFAVTKGKVVEMVEVGIVNGKEIPSSIKGKGWAHIAVLNHLTEQGVLNATR